MLFPCLLDTGQNIGAASVRNFWLPSRSTKAQAQQRS